MAIQPKPCDRFTPRQEKSVYCRTCDAIWYQHVKDNKRFGPDGIKRIHKAYMSDEAVIKWLLTLGTDLHVVLAKLRDMLKNQQEIPDAPDLVTIQSLESIVRQMSIEDAVNQKIQKGEPTHCTNCGNPLELSEDKVCTECIQAHSDPEDPCVRFIPSQIDPSICEVCGFAENLGDHGTVIIDISDYHSVSD